MPHTTPSSAPLSDIAIVGGGPAGAWTAYLLARAGARVTIYDGSHPREKPCGGGVTGRALGLVADAFASRTVPGVAITHARFAETDIEPARVDLAARGFSPDTDLIVVSRRDFDRALLDAAVEAGARHVAARVSDVAVSADRVQLDVQGRVETAGFVVGADGANSLVRRRLGRSFPRSQISIASGYFAWGVSSAAIDVRFASKPAGYLWSFPRPDHLAVGACAQADQSSAAALREGTASWIESASLAPAARLERYSWPIPSLDGAALSADVPAGGRWLLVGDAAGLVDPITREGIFFALRSAQLASDALTRGGEAGTSYVKSLSTEIHPELARAARLKRGFFLGGFTRLVIEALHHSAGVRAVMRDLIAGRQPYATLKRRLLGTFEVGLAWELLKLEVGLTRGRNSLVDGAP